MATHVLAHQLKGRSDAIGLSAMELDDFLKATEVAVRGVFESDIDLIDSKANEEAIAHRFAVYLESSFPEMNVDCEYNRYGEELSPEQLPGIEKCKEGKETGWIIPDILVHVRKSKEEDNLAVFEIKSGSELDECDKLKLMGMTMKSGRFKYDFGMGVEFYPDHCDRLLFVDGEQQGEPIRSDGSQTWASKRVSKVGGGGPGSGSRAKIEENADVVSLDKAARKKIQGLTPDMAVKLYDNLNDKLITELTDSEYAERLVLAERMSEILRNRRKQKS
jgi:hypothetical protein